MFPEGGATGSSAYRGTIGSATGTSTPSHVDDELIATTAGSSFHGAVYSSSVHDQHDILDPSTVPTFIPTDLPTWAIPVAPISSSSPAASSAGSKRPHAVISQGATDYTPSSTQLFSTSRPQTTASSSVIGQSRKRSRTSASPAIA